MELTTIITMIVGALLAVSEALSLIPGVRSNGIFQVVWNVLKIIGGTPPKKED